MVPLRRFESTQGTTAWRCAYMNLALSAVVVAHYPEGMARRPLQALQVEVTSRCSRSCAVCPRSPLGDRWLDGDLSDEHWERLRGDLRLTEHVHLQGWGEPLLHEPLRSRVEDAHSAGCRVGITTNGDLLSDAAEWIVAEGVELITLSLAGLDESNRRLRGGADPRALLEGLSWVARVRGRRRRPRLQVSFLLVRDNACDLPHLVRAAAAAGADAVLVNHLDFTPTAELAAAAAFRLDGFPESSSETLSEATTLAERLAIGFRPASVEPREMLACALDPRTILSVRWDGRMAPCVQLNLPIDGPIPRWTEHGTEQVDPPVLGYLDESTLPEVLAGPAFREFIAPLEKRYEADRRFRDCGLVASGWGVVGIRDLDQAYDELERRLAETPFPPACRGCPKVHGW
jgi:MoaA/NifB/PqqE/SkfB family radical SAM enzyme